MQFVRLKLFHRTHYIPKLFFNQIQFNKYTTNFTFDPKSLEKLTRRELQKLAKEASIPANQKSEVIRAKLIEKFELNDPKLARKYFDDSLSNEQKYILNKAVAGENLFFTGGAGTGKSHLLREITKVLQQKYSPNSVFITSSTGVSAVNIGGCTVHHFSGIGFGNLDQFSLLNLVNSKKNAKKNWKDAKVLIIDEISMLNGLVFEKMEFIARMIRGNNLPFGGIQLIVCGDFLQLPPIANDDLGEQQVFCFETEAWNRVIQSHYELTNVFRQSDPVFIKTLNSIRVGKIDSEVLDVLETCKHRKFPDDSISPTKLYSYRKLVDGENRKRLMELPGESKIYKATDTGIEPYLSIIKRSCMAPETLELKKGAQVILLKNLSTESGLVNGSRGVVIDYDLDGYPIVKFTNGKILTITPTNFSIEIGKEKVANRNQIPLAVAYALSIHKAQGMTISCMETQLYNIFEYGQAYVALSRCSSLEGLRLSRFSRGRIKDVVRAHPKVLKFYEKLNVKSIPNEGEW